MPGLCVCRRVFINLQFVQIEIGNKKYAWWKQINFEKLPFITKSFFLFLHEVVFQAIWGGGAYFAKLEWLSLFYFYLSHDVRATEFIWSRWMKSGTVKMGSQELHGCDAG